MAIFHLRVSSIGRSKGRSAVAAAAYDARAKLTDERQGETFAYRNVDNELIHSEIIVPDGSPAWARDRQELWNAAENVEDVLAIRRYGEDSVRGQHLMETAITAYEVEVAIPIELNKEQAVRLVTEFAKVAFVERGQVADVNIHWKQGNPHAHIQLTTRGMNPYGLSDRKDKNWRGPTETRNVRSLWAGAVNQALTMAGFDVRVDHRSFEDLGLPFEPTKHEGWEARQIAARDAKSRIVEENDDIRAKNRDIALNRPEVIIHEISYTRATFSRQDLAREVSKRVGLDPELFAIAFAKIEASPLLVKVGVDIHGQVRLTTKTYLAREAAMKAAAETLYRRTGHGVSRQRVEAGLSGKFAFLSEEQKNAVRSLTSNRGLDILVGRAGSGKTTLLEAVATAYKEEGYRVRGAALAGVAADNLAAEARIEARTLESWRVGWQKIDETTAQIESEKDPKKKYGLQRYLEKLKATYELGPKDVLVVDEAGMLATIDVGRVVDRAVAAGAKVILAGDPEQFAAIQAGASLRGLVDDYGASYVNEIRRQKVGWQKDASAMLSRLDVGDAVNLYHSHGAIQFHDAPTVDGKRISGSVAAITADYLHDLDANPSQSRLVLGYTNAQVNEMNASIRAALVERGLVETSIDIGQGKYGAGDRIILLSPDNGRLVQTVAGERGPVRNGTVGTVLSVDGTTITMRVDGDHDRRIRFDAAVYKDYAHAYAVTEYKAQGKTVDRVFLLASKHMRADAAYVAMTRHRHDLKVYADKDEFEDTVDLARSFGRLPEKDLTADYILDADKRERFNRVAEYIDVSKAAASLYAEIDAQIKPDQEPWDHDRWEEFTTLTARRSNLAEEIVDGWHDHALYVRQASLSKESIEIHAGRRERRLSDVEKEAFKAVQAYAEISKKTRDFWNEIKATHPGLASRRHPEFSQFEVLRDERNSAARELLNAPALYRPFAKPANISWKAVRIQGKQHDMAMDAINAVQSLGADGARVSVAAAEFREARDLASTLWQMVKEDSLVMVQGLPQPVDGPPRDGYMRLYRGEGIHDAALEFKAGSGLTGRWFTEDINVALEYAKGENGKLFYVDIAPENLRHLIADQDAPGSSFIIPREIAATKTAYRETVEVKPVQRPYERSQFFAEWQETQAIRDRRAYRLARNGDAYRQLAEHLSLKPEQVAEAAARHRARVAVKAYRLAETRGNVARRDAIAFAATKEATVYKRVFREQGIPWRDVMASARAELDRRTDFTLHPAHRPALARVIEYDNLRRDLAKRWDGIVSESLAVNKAPVEHEAFAAWRADRNRRDQLAAEIMDKITDHHSFLLSRKIPAEGLERHANAGRKTAAMEQRAAQVRENMTRYLTARQGRSPVQQGLAASLIADDIKAHLPALRDAGIHWRQIRTEADAYKVNQFIKSLPTDQAERYRRVAKFVQLQRAANKMWVKLNGELEPNAKPWSHSDYPKWEVVRRQRNAVAAEIRTDLPRHEFAIEHQKVDAAKIMEAAGQHDRTRTVRQQPQAEELSVDAIVAATERPADPVEEYRRAATRADQLLASRQSPEAITAAYADLQARAANIYSDPAAFQALAAKDKQLASRIQGDALHHKSLSTKPLSQGLSQ